MLHGAAAVWAWVVGGLVSLATAITAGGIVWSKWGRPLWNRGAALADLIERELNHNGGESIKDDVAEASTQAQLQTNILIDLAQRVEKLEDDKDHKAAHRRVTDRLRSIERTIKENLT